MAWETARRDAQSGMPVRCGQQFQTAPVVISGRIFGGRRDLAARTCQRKPDTMTGTIVALAGNARTGTIRSLDGSRVTFSAANVLGDFDALAVGHMVSFDLERPQPHHIAARVFREPSGAHGAVGKLGASPDLRYTGFHQDGRVRSYCFDAVVPGVQARQFTVKVDMALLLKHRIGVQDVPALCLRKLTADLGALPESGQHELRDEELLALASSRAAAAIVRKRAKHSFAGRRGAPPPGPSRGVRTS